MTKIADDKSSQTQIAQATLDAVNQAVKVVVTATTPGVQQEVDIREIAGAAPSAANPLPVRLTDGSGFYSANAGFILDNVNVTAEQDTAVPADNKGSPVVILPGQGQAPISPATSGNQVSTNTKLDTLITQTDGVEGSLTSIDGKTPALGQALAAASVPVVLTAAQITTLTPQTNALTDTQLRASAVPVSGTVAVTQSGTWNITNISGTISLPTGAATESTLSSFSAKFPDASFGSATSSPRIAAVVGNAGGVNAFTNPFYISPSSGATFAISAASLPLPSGAATETTLAGIRTRVDVVDHGSTSTAQRVAADIGVGGTAVSNSNAVPISDAGGSITIDGTVGISNLPAVVDTAFGTVGAATPRSASLIGVGTAAVSASNPVPVSSVGGSSVQLASATVHPYFQDFATSSLTTAYTQVIASLGTTVQAFSATNNSATPIYIATGAAASEVVRYIVMPGENTGRQLLTIASGTRIAIATQGGTESSGKFALNVFSN